MVAYVCPSLYNHGIQYADIARMRPVGAQTLVPFFQLTAFLTEK